MQDYLPKYNQISHLVQVGDLVKESSAAKLIYLEKSLKFQFQHKTLQNFTKLYMSSSALSRYLAPWQLVWCHLSIMRDLTVRLV